MRLSIKAFTVAAGLLWGGGILLVGLVNLAAPAFGVHFLQLISSRQLGGALSRAGTRCRQAKHDRSDQRERPALSVRSHRPGYHATRSFGEVLIGTGYGLVDGGLGGFFLSWLYNWIAAGEASAAR